MKQIVLFIALLSWTKVLSQQNNVVTALQGSDTYMSNAVNIRYHAGFCFKSAPESDTSSRDAEVMLFERGLYPNDTLKSFIISYANGKGAYVFDGRFFHKINHSAKTISSTDVAVTGIRKAMRGWPSDFIFAPFIRKGKRHFLPEIYSNATRLKPSRHPDYTLIEHLDSIPNTQKIAAQDPDFITIITQLETVKRTGALRHVRRWAYFMATPQYEDFYFSDFIPLPDTSTFSGQFDMAYYLQQDYKEETKQQQSPPQMTVTKGDIFPSFHLSDMNGVPWYLDSLKSGVVILDFWYRSCYPCLKAMTALESLHQKYAEKGVLILGINSRDPSGKEVKDFLNSRNVHYNSLMDEKGRFASQINISGFPTLFLIDAASKKILLAQGGYSEETEATLEALIREQLGEKKE